jgi:phosphatidylglycerophosphate synthase
VLAGSLSDLLDGALGRRLRATSATGRLLDPVADKVFVLAVVATLCWEGSVEIWQMALVGARDLAVGIGSAWMFLREGPSAREKMLPTRLGKVTTAAQCVFVVSVLAFGVVVLPLFVVTAICSFVAAGDYVRRYVTGRT